MDENQKILYELFGPVLSKIGETYSRNRPEKEDMWKDVSIAFLRGRIGAEIMEFSNAMGGPRELDEVLDVAVCSFILAARLLEESEDT